MKKENWKEIVIEKLHVRSIFPIFISTLLSQPTILLAFTNLQNLAYFYLFSSYNFSFKSNNVISNFMKCNTRKDFIERTGEKLIFLIGKHFNAITWNRFFANENKFNGWTRGEKKSQSGRKVMNYYCMINVNVSLQLVIV